MKSKNSTTGEIVEANEQAVSLFLRISSIALSDHEVPMAFESKLADQNGWTLGFATRVVVEYRRFLVLTQLAGHAVCPSEEVDAAWHLHLTQTRRYRAVCDEIFGRFLHHDPSKGGDAELQWHREMYGKTLASYRAMFGFEPPAHLWPSVDKRFGTPQSQPASAGWALPASLAQGKPLMIGAFVAALLLAALLHAVDSLNHLPSWLLIAVVIVGLIAFTLWDQAAMEERAKRQANARKEPFPAWDNSSKSNQAGGYGGGCAGGCGGCGCGG